MSLMATILQFHTCWLVVLRRSLQMHINTWKKKQKIYSYQWTPCPWQVTQNNFKQGVTASALHSSSLMRQWQIKSTKWKGRAPCHCRQSPHQSSVPQSLTWALQHGVIWKFVPFSTNPFKHETWPSVLISILSGFLIEQIVVLIFKFLALDNSSQHLPSWVGFTKMWSHTASYLLQKFAIISLVLLLLETKVFRFFIFYLGGRGLFTFSFSFC